MKKVWRYLIFTCVTVLCIMMHIMLNGGVSTYVERAVAFKFSQNPKRLYAFDGFSEGMDYDVLKIYQIDSDIERFEKHLRDENWHTLPLTNEILNHPLCSLSFDVNMKEMLSCTNGYWYWDEEFEDLMVYDAENHKIFIRRASVLSNTPTRIEPIN